MMFEGRRAQERFTQAMEIPVGSDMVYNAAHGWSEGAPRWRTGMAVGKGASR